MIKDRFIISLVALWYFSFGSSILYAFDYFNARAGRPGGTLYLALPLRIT